jgi:hypothetical protein
MGCGRALEESLLLGVAVEPGHGAQSPGDGGASTAAIFEITGVALDVSAPHCEQAQGVLLAPGDELAQVQGVGVSGQAAVAGQERGEGVPFSIGERGIDDRNIGR